MLLRFRTFGIPGIIGDHQQKIRFVPCLFPGGVSKHIFIANQHPRLRIGADGKRTERLARFQTSSQPDPLIQNREMFRQRHKLPEGDQMNLGVDVVRVIVILFQIRFFHMFQQKGRVVKRARLIGGQCAEHQLRRRIFFQQPPDRFPVARFKRNIEALSRMSCLVLFKICKIVITSRNS